MSPPPERSPGTRGNDAGEPGEQEFSPHERSVLLRLAHDAICAELDGRAIATVAPSPHLAQPRGAFTTLYYQGNLRGCVGYVFPTCPLYQTVVETARAAAFADTRFWPVERDELPELEVSLSILSPLQPTRPEEIEIGRHGLVVSVGERRGLLLPQVPGEHGWDRLTFLEQTCRKAGLPPDAWQQGALLEVFTAEIFGDGKA